jgi:Fur family ferric uptake transcriptional regulator
MTVAPPRPRREFEHPEAVLNVLRTSGMRVSAARRLIVDRLFAAEAPVSAEEIAHGPGGAAALDLASVYRNLETLQRLGLVSHCHAGHGPGRYVLAGTGEREYLACERCGGLTAVEPGDLDAVRVAIRERFGFEARFTHFPIVGLCPNCVHERSHR